MKIYLQGHDYKYEMENIIRMFFPLQKFAYLLEQSPMPQEEYLLCAISREKENLRLSAVLQKNGCRKEKSILLPFTEEHNVRERELAKVLYRLLKEDTGLSPEWGIITGVRPVKLFEKKLDEGLSRQGVKQYFMDEWYVSPSKADLSLAVADSQKEILKENSYKDFSFYVSIPYCPTRCSYCSFVSQAVSSKKVVDTIPVYLENLVKEIYFTAKIAQQNGLRLKTVYIGGGTPTVLSEEQLKILLSAVVSAFPEAPRLEFTVEAGRPDTITEGKLRTLKEYGVNRISINPQTFSDKVLQAIGRKHTAVQTEEAFWMARKIGFDSINMDLIAGLPQDTLSSFQESLFRAAELSPENITVHALTVKRSSALYEQMNGSEDPAPTTQMTGAASQFLFQQGYLPYYLYRQKNTLGNLENVGYAKPLHFCRYNVYIMEEVQTILSAGAGAVTKLVGKDGSIHRIYNYKYPSEYLSGFENIIARKESVSGFFCGEES